MATKSKKAQVLVDFTPTLKDELGKAAQRENRSMSKMVYTIVDNYIKITKDTEAYKNYNNIMFDLNNKSET
jgi:hypothetical protein